MRQADPCHRFADVALGCRLATPKATFHNPVLPMLRFHSIPSSSKDFRTRGDWRRSWRCSLVMRGHLRLSPPPLILDVHDAPRLRHSRDDGCGSAGLTGASTIIVSADAWTCARSLSRSLNGGVGGEAIPRWAISSWSTGSGAGSARTDGEPGPAAQGAIWITMLVSPGAPLASQFQLRGLRRFDVIEQRLVTRGLDERRQLGSVVITAISTPGCQPARMRAANPGSET